MSSAYPENYIDYYKDQHGQPHYHGVYYTVFIPNLILLLISTYECSLRPKAPHNLWTSAFNSALMTC